MEALAQELEQKIDNICGGYHYYKDENVIERARELAAGIQQLCSVLLQENIFEMEETGFLSFQNYVLQVLRDYTQALQYRDMVLMLDVLDYGLRELLDIFIDKDGEGTEHE